METGRHFVSYIAVAVFILLYEYSNARPTMDSLYGDYVYSGAIYPISGAVPKKIHSHRQNSHHQKSRSDASTAAEEMKAQSNAPPTMDSLYGDHVYSGAIYPISGAVPKKIHSNRDTPMADSNSDTSTADSNNDISTADSNRDTPMADSNRDTPMADSNSDTSTADSNNDISTADSNRDTPMADSNRETPTADSHHKTKEMKSQIDMLGIDLSQIDLSQIDVTHKFDGKDSLQPSLCHDTYNDRYGVGKHFVRGVRDVGFAVVSGAEGLIDGLLADLPLVPNIASGIGGGLKAVICAIEDGFSDIGSDLDSALDIAKNGLVDLFKLKGPHPVLDIPVGIGGIAREGVKAAGQLVGDTVGGVKNAVGEILDAL